jgi:hypothetical protein
MNPVAASTALYSIWSCHNTPLLLMLRHLCCRVFTVTFSMMEIYCEMLNDLLDPSKLNLDVQVWLSPTDSKNVI